MTNKKDMKTILDNTITETAKAIYEQTIKYNHRFTLEKAMKLAVKKMQYVQHALQHPERYMVDDNGVITRTYNYGNIQDLNSIYGNSRYCGD